MNPGFDPRRVKHKGWLSTSEFSLFLKMAYLVFPGSALSDV